MGRPRKLKLVVSNGDKPRKQSRQMLIADVAREYNCSGDRYQMAFLHGLSYSDLERLYMRRLTQKHPGARTAAGFGRDGGVSVPLSPIYPSGY